MVLTWRKVHMEQKIMFNTRYSQFKKRYFSGKKMIPTKKWRAVLIYSNKAAFLIKNVSESFTI